MSTPKKVWFTLWGWQLRCEVNGLILTVERSARPEIIVFTVLAPADPLGPSGVLVSGIEPSVLGAMAAAEEAAAMLAPWPDAVITSDDAPRVPCSQVFAGLGVTTL
jgi:hypothetical protein